MESTVIEIPNKQYFKLNEVCSITGVKSYVLRFWESEFSQISAVTATDGQKLYKRHDIEFILTVKKMLFDDKLTIEKAKARLPAPLSNETDSADEVVGAPVRDIAAIRLSLSRIIELCNGLEERVARI